MAAPRSVVLSTSTPCLLIDIADVPGGGQLHLVRVGADLEILVDGEQLMSS